MKIVCNASPLINLARIGKLDLLRELYGELIIPEAVWHEVVEEGSGQPGAEEVKCADWVKTQYVTNRNFKKQNPYQTYRRTMGTHYGRTL